MICNSLCNLCVDWYGLYRPYCTDCSEGKPCSHSVMICKLHVITAIFIHNRVVTYSLLIHTDWQLQLTVHNSMTVLDMR